MKKLSNSFLHSAFLILNSLIDTARRKACAEAIVDIDDGHAGGATVEHAEQGG